MEELLEYRQRLINKFTEAGLQLENAVSRIRDPFQPLEKDGWNLHQIAIHMRDVNQEVYLPRLDRIMLEENPVFENFDGEAWMNVHYDPQESLQKVVREFKEQCCSRAAWLLDLPIEAWNRLGSHPILGRHSLQWWVERTLALISEHDAQLNSTREAEK